MNATNRNKREMQALVIGAGLAGCTAALTMADGGIKVTLITSTPDLLSGNSPLAQGGIVYKAEDGDPGQLEKDILVAGHYLNNHWAVRHLSRKGPQIVNKILMERVKIPFARKGDHGSHVPESCPATENAAATGVMGNAPYSAPHAARGSGPHAMRGSGPDAVSDAVPGHVQGAQCEGEWDLAREGGHVSSRIVHCADYTGLAIMQGLIAAVKESPNITVLTRRTAIDLLTVHHHSRSKTYRYQVINKCCGAYVFNEENSEVETIFADVTMLASGGAGQIFLHSTNAQSAIGSALAMASRALVRMENLEYVQFHPTAFFDHEPRRFLITEAMRGEGAKLINAKGEHFMKRYDQREDLAPRDVVSQAIVTELLLGGEPCVFLDAANNVRHNLAERFPTIYKHCLKHGVDITKDPIPVVPAAHYFCGGILSDLCGRTSLENLYSIGECSCTGLHGANRLASTSLLEALVWGYSAAEDAIKHHAELRISQRLIDSIPDWEYLGNEKNDDPALLAQDWNTIRSTVWNYVGIVRSKPRLRRAFEELRDLSTHVHDFYKLTRISKPLIELFHGCQAAYVLTQAAMRNPKKLGCHNMVD